MNTSPARNVLTYRWIIFWIMALGYLCVFFYRVCPSVVCLDIQKAFEVSACFMGFLTSAYFYPYVLMQFPAGLLSDSLGPRETITFFLSVAAIGSILFGVAPGADVALLARVVMGLGVSMAFIPMMKVLSRWFRTGEFTFMVAILNVIGGIGMLIAATPLVSISEWIGWRSSFQVTGLGTLFVAGLIWLFVRNKPQDNGWPSIAEIDGTVEGANVSPPAIGLWQGARLVFTEK
jgi:sugar phosphate permease